MMRVSDGSVECDVLVIGGGLAGAWAALRAREFTDNVVLVDKSRVSRSGMSSFAAGVMLCPTSEDNLREWAEELVENGEYLCDQRWVELMLREQIERLKDLERWGVPFERDNEGKISRVLGRGHRRTRILMFHGKRLMEQMRKQLLQKGIRLVERTTVTGLLTSDGQYPTRGTVVGAAGFNPRTEEFLTFKARATVLAAGPINGKFGGGYCDNLTGDGVAMAFKTGAELTGMEFAVRGNSVVWARKYITYGINMIQGANAKFVNARGERYMDKYMPGLGERARKNEICLAMCKEVLEGRGPLYCDMTGVSAEWFARFRRVIPHTMRVFDAAGIDPAKEPVEYGTLWAIHTAAMDGGIRINLDCETGIPGLFSAGGENWNPTHGTYSVGGNNLAFCNVSGHRAGESAARYARGSAGAGLPAAQVAALKEYTLAPLGRRDGARPDDIFEGVYRAVSPAKAGVFKSEARLSQSLADVRSIKQTASRLTATNYHELVKAHEAANYALLSEVALQAALERKESRGFHFREDYPERDDINWLKWVVLKLENGEIGTRLEPVPIDEYPAKPAELRKQPRPVAFFFDRPGESKHGH